MKKKINWEKGFLRIWFVGTSIWVLLMIFAALTIDDIKWDIWFGNTFGWPVGILIFVYVSKALLDFIIGGFSDDK